MSSHQEHEEWVNVLVEKGLCKREVADKALRLWEQMKVMFGNGVKPPAAWCTSYGKIEYVWYGDHTKFMLCVSPDLVVGGCFWDQKDDNFMTFGDWSEGDES